MWGYFINLSLNQTHTEAGRLSAVVVVVVVVLVVVVIPQVFSSVVIGLFSRNSPGKEFPVEVKDCCSCPNVRCDPCPKMTAPKCNSACEANDVARDKSTGCRYATCKTVRERERERERE